MPRSGIQLCVPFEERRLARWDPPFLVQPKLDGERCRAIFSGPDNVGYRLLSSEQNEFRSVPHINEALNKLWRSTGLTAELDGELYCHKMPFNELHARVGRTVNFHPDFQTVQFHIFDVVDEQAPQYERSFWLFRRANFFTHPLATVPATVCETFDAVIDCYEELLAKGYEGIIVRHAAALYERKRSTFVMKFKPKKSDWYTVVGYKEELDKYGDPKDSLGALVCCSDDGTEFSVGSGLTREQRLDYWRNRSLLPGSLCHVQYQHTLKTVPRFPVFVELVKQKEILSGMVG
jgi:ATP-dependent DNA ligase